MVAVMNQTERYRRLKSVTTKSEHHLRRWTTISTTTNSKVIYSLCFLVGLNILLCEQADVGYSKPSATECVDWDDVRYCLLSKSLCGADVFF